MRDIQRKTWEEFRKSGLLWWVNRSLHLVGWAIVVERSTEDHSNAPTVDVYPARVKYRGFSEDVEAHGFVVVSEYLRTNIADLTAEAFSAESEPPK